MDWANCVNLAGASLRIKEYTIPVGIVAKAPAISNQFGVQKPNFADRFPEFRRDCGEFLVRYPHRSGAPRTAVTALRTLEFQSVSIPGRGGFLALGFTGIAGIIATVSVTARSRMTVSTGLMRIVVLTGSDRHFCLLRAIDRVVRALDAISHHSVTYGSQEVRTQEGGRTNA